MNGNNTQETLATFSKVKAIGVHEQIVDQIVNMVLSGELREGDKLPSERLLKEQFNVSRASLREALRILSTLGIIEARAGSGIYVTKQTGRNIEKNISLMYMPTSTKDIIELLEFRRLIECECIKTAVDYITDEDIKELEKCIALAGDSRSEVSIAADRDFHYIIAQKSGKRVFYESMSAMMLAVTEALRIMRQLDEFYKISLKSQTEHREILDALCAKDRVLAEKAMFNHLTSVQDDLTKLLN